VKSTAIQIGVVVAGVAVFSVALNILDNFTATRNLARYFGRPFGA